MIGEYYNIDCMELMSHYPDKHFDLAIVDPEYGVNISKNICYGMGRKNNKYKATKYIAKKWDSSPPNKEYFKELIRVSKNQIIFGYNYFTEILGSSNSLIFWDKLIGDNNFSAGELIYTSFKHNLRKITISIASESNRVSCNINIAVGNARIHPTQKPVKLYEWLLNNYAKPNDLILDTHCGSASSLIACENLGFKYVASELDTDYYSESLKRLKTHLLQDKLFQPVIQKNKIDTPSMFTEVRWSREKSHCTL